MLLPVPVVPMNLKCLNSSSNGTAATACGIRAGGNRRARARSFRVAAWAAPPSNTSATRRPIAANGRLRLAQ